MRWIDAFNWWWRLPEPWPRLALFDWQLALGAAFVCFWLDLGAEGAEGAASPLRGRYDGSQTSRLLVRDC